MVAGEDVPSRSQPPLTHTFLMAAEVQQEGRKKSVRKRKESTHCRCCFLLHKRQSNSQIQQSRSHAMAVARSHAHAQLTTRPRCLLPRVGRGGRTRVSSCVCSALTFCLRRRLRCHRPQRQTETTRRTALDCADGPPLPSAHDSSWTRAASWLEGCYSSSCVSTPTALLGLLAVER